MNAVHEPMDGTKDSVPVTAAAKKAAVAVEGGYLMGENDRRAVEIGPVLEEILRNHWEHWGLND